MYQLAPHSTLNTSTSSLSLTSLLCCCRPLLRIWICCPRIHETTVKMHGGMVLLRSSSPPQKKHSCTSDVGQHVQRTTQQTNCHGSLAVGAAHENCHSKAGPEIPPILLARVRIPDTHWMVSSHQGFRKHCTTV